MTRKLMLPLLVACGTFALSAPAANAASLGSKVGQLSGTVAGLQKAVNGLKDENKGEAEAIDRVNNRVDTVVKNLAPVLDALPTVAKALSAIADPVTGLAAVNLARPLFASLTVEDPTNRPAHTGIATNAASGGFAKAQRVASSLDNVPTYFLDWGKDVSKRLGVVSVASRGGENFDDASLMNCGASPAANQACSRVLQGTGLPANNNTSLLTIPGVEASYGGNGSGNQGVTYNVLEVSP